MTTVRASHLRASHLRAVPTSPAPAGCGRIGEVLARIGDRWTVTVVMALRDGPKRFNEIRRDIGTISQRMLSLTLRGLERDGLVSRTVHATVPPRVDYELTPLGHSLRQPVEALGRWTFTHLAAVDAARRRYDQAAAHPGPVAVPNVRRHVLLG